MKKSFLTLLCVWSLCIAVQAQDSTKAREHIKFLTSKELHGRGVGYNGEFLAAEYIRDQLNQLGVEPLGDDYYQPYELPAFSMEGDVKCMIDDKSLTAGKDYRILPFSKTLIGDFNLIQIKPSDLINSKKIDGINKKYAPIMGKSLVYFDDSKANFKKKDDKEKYKKACEISQYKNPFNSLGIIKGSEKMPAWGMAHTDFERDLAYLYMDAHCISSNSKIISLHYFNELIPYTHNNVCGIIPGTEHPEEYIVLTCHYDHLGSMGEEVYFPGAHDNASGCAFVLNMAQYFSEHPCKYSMVFLFFAGEESGLVGSKFFTENPLIPLNEIKYLLNFDLLCGGDEGITLVNSTEGAGKDLYVRIQELNDELKLLPKIAERDNAPNSDHYFFTQHKVPALFLYTLGGKTGGYHDPSDTCEACALTMFDNIFRLFTTLIGKEE